jgi:predicted phage terminase large subunit-like protein
MKLKVPYGNGDPEGNGNAFFWPTSPSKRAEMLSIKRNNPMVYESVYQCRPGQRQGSIFLESDFAYYIQPPKLEFGVGQSSIREFLSRFQMIATGWDTAYGATRDSDPTVGIAAGFLYCEKYHCGEDPLLIGPCDPHFDVYLFDLFRDYIPWGELIGAIRKFHHKWYPQVHVVEEKASGISAVQTLPTMGINVEGVKSIESKLARAISGTEAGSVQGWFRQHRVRLPQGASWVESYVREMKDFTGDDDSADDQVDATTHLVNYAIQHGAGMALMSSSWAPEAVDAILAEQAMRPTTDPVFQTPRSILSYIHMLPAYSNDPFYGTCGRCMRQTNSYCDYQNRLVSALDGCDNFTPHGE